MSDPIKRGFWYALIEIVLQNRPPHQIRALKKWILIVAFGVTTFALAIFIVFAWFVISLIPSRQQLVDVYSSASVRAQSLIADFNKVPVSTDSLCTENLKTIKNHPTTPTPEEISAWDRLLVTNCTTLAPTFLKIKDQTFTICKEKPQTNSKNNCDFAFKNLQATTEFYLASQNGDVSGFDRVAIWFKSGVVMILKENPFLRNYF